MNDLDRLIEHLERTARDMRLRAEGIESALTMARAFRLADTFTAADEGNHQ